MDSILYEVVVSTKGEVDGGEEEEASRKEPELCGGDLLVVHWTALLYMLFVPEVRRSSVFPCFTVSSCSV